MGKMNQELELIRILEEEIETYKSLLSLKEREKDALLNFSSENLEDCNAVQEALTKQGLGLETNRNKVVRQISRKWRRGEKSPTLRELVEIVSPVHRPKVLSLGEELTRVCDRIALAQDANARLIDTAKNYLRDLVETLLKKAQPDVVEYNLGGMKTAGRDAAPSLVDTRL